jgi:nucleoside diphosphate kinase
VRPSQQEGSRCAALRCSRGSGLVKELPFSRCSARPGMASQTLALLKPDVIASGNSDSVLAAIEEEGFTVIQQDLRLLTLSLARELYEEHSEKDFFNDLVKYICSGPVMVLLLAKSGDAVTAFGNLMGPTNSEKARAEAPDSCGLRACCPPACMS